MAIPSISLVVEWVRSSFYGIPTACGLGMTRKVGHGCSNFGFFTRQASPWGLTKAHSCIKICRANVDYLLEVKNMYEKLVAFAAEHLELDPAEITPESTFEDLGIDSLDIVEMVMELEGELGVDLEVEDETITTFGQMAAFIESKVG